MRGRGKFSRRTLLAATAVGPALLPLLEDDLARAACLPAGRKRLVVIHWGNGLEQRAAAAGAGFTLPAIMKALEPHKADLLIPDALSNKAFSDSIPAGSGMGSHESPHSVLIAQRMPPAGPAPTPSLDYLIGNTFARAGQTRFPVLNLGVMFNTFYSGSWQAASVAAAPVSNPYFAFDRIFGGPTAGSEAWRVAVRKSVLDYVTKDIGRLSRRLGAEDRTRIDGHLSSIREIENRLAPPTVPVGCEIPTVGPKVKHTSSDNYDKVLTLQMDIGLAAMAAGLTQVLTLHATSGSGAHFVASWLGYAAKGVPGKGILGDANSHHGLAHAGGGPKNAIDAWFFEKVAYLIARMKAAREGSGSMFDNSVVLATNYQEGGGRHSMRNIPWLLAGSAGGVFRTGRLLPARNASHAQVLVGICNAFGVSPEGWADPAYGGELPGMRG